MNKSHLYYCFGILFLCNVCAARTGRRILVKEDYLAAAKRLGIDETDFEVWWEERMSGKTGSSRPMKSLDLKKELESEIQRKANEETLKQLVVFAGIVVVIKIMLYIPVCRNAKDRFLRCLFRKQRIDESWSARDFSQPIPTSSSRATAGYTTLQSVNHYGEQPVTILSAIPFHESTMSAQSVQPVERETNDVPNYKEAMNAQPPVLSSTHPPPYPSSCLK